MANEDLLKLLEAHGQQFLQSFDTPILTGKRKSGPEETERRASKKNKPDPESESEEEWGGITGDLASEEEEGEGGSYSEEEGDNDTDEELDEDEDDGFTYESKAHQPDVVVFSETGTSSIVPKASKSGFMSSKVSKLSQEAAQPSKRKAGGDEEDDDLTNAQNDALLHRLVHTQLLSGSLNPDLNLTPAQRKKALAGRVLEAAGKAKLGKGEAAVRQAERNRAAKHVREGLEEKQQERRKKELEEAKHLGNYHPKLKSLYDDSGSSKPRKRERGMKMGVGSFGGGILRLSKKEISAVEERTAASRGRGGRGRGGRSRGGGRGGRGRGGRR